MNPIFPGGLLAISGMVGIIGTAASELPLALKVLLVPLAAAVFAAGLLVFGTL